MAEKSQKNTGDDKGLSLSLSLRLYAYRLLHLYFYYHYYGPIVHVCMCMLMQHCMEIKYQYVTCELHASAKLTCPGTS